MCVFENIMYPLVGLGLVDAVDVDEYVFEASHISETIPNQSLLKKLSKACAMCIFENMTYPLDLQRWVRGGSCTANTLST